MHHQWWIPTQHTCKAQPGYNVGVEQSIQKVDITCSHQKFAKNPTVDKMCGSHWSTVRDHPPRWQGCYVVPSVSRVVPLHASTSNHLKKHPWYHVNKKTKRDGTTRVELILIQANTTRGRHSNIIIRCIIIFKTCFIVVFALLYSSIVVFAKNQVKIAACLTQR